jgi:hypothetical protein
MMFQQNHSYNQQQSTLIQFHDSCFLNLYQMISIILSSSTSNNSIEKDNVLKSIRIKEKLLSAINMFLIFEVFAHVNNYSSISYESSKSRTRFGDDKKPPERHSRGVVRGRTQSRSRGHETLMSSLIQTMTNDNKQKSPALLFQRLQCVDGPRCLARLAPLQRIRLPKPPSASEAQEGSMLLLLLLLLLQSSTYDEAPRYRAPAPDIPGERKAEVLVDTLVSAVDPKSWLPQT